ncbi:MAG: site-specific DNA-methyltransferase [Alphaproteobacteria bacterium]
MAKKQKLELTWIGKDTRPKLEPRILLEDTDKSYHAKHKITDSDIFDNRLIFGDNLLALRALEQEFTGKIKCVYIDPPYNTGNAFDLYDDGVEHSIWLSLMRGRLEILRKLLRRDGFICCQIDDSEGQYLKVLMYEVFGRANYLTTIYVHVRYPEKTLKQDMDFHKLIEQIHVYRKDYGAKPNLNKKQGSFEKFSFYVNEKAEGKATEIGGKKAKIFYPGEYEIIEGEGSDDGLKEIWASGTILDGNSSGRFFRDYLTGRDKEDGLGVLYKVEGIGDDKFPYRYFTGPKRQGATKGKYYQGVPNSQLENPDQEKTSPIENFLDLAASFGNCRQEGGVEFRSGKKPEVLIHKLLGHFSSPGDWVLDSFAGSGTTAAVAHKMRRRWVTVELGDHCHTHVIPRLQGVVDGQDKTGVTETTHWKGGGGFRYYYLAPSLLQKDKWDNWVISNEYNAAMLSEAMCKLMGFTYQPNSEHYWVHGHSSETDFIYVTTSVLTHDQLKVISEEVGKNRTLLICCKAFKANQDVFENLTIRKIPAAVLIKCEWGKDDYSLNVANLQPKPEPENKGNGTPSLFDKMQEG